MPQEELMGRQKRRSFTDEQKRAVIALAKREVNVSQVARDLDINRSILARWIRQAEIDAGKGPAGALTTEEKAELQRLRRENKTLRMERDFLKKAAAFFAKDGDRRSS